VRKIPERLLDIQDAIARIMKYTKEGRYTKMSLPPGAFTLVFTLNIAMLSIMQDHYILIVPAALAGLAAALSKNPACIS